LDQHPWAMRLPWRMLLTRQVPTDHDPSGWTFSSFSRRQVLGFRYLPASAASAHFSSKLCSDFRRFCLFRNSRHAWSQPGSLRSAAHHDRSHRAAGLAIGCTTHGALTSRLEYRAYAGRPCDQFLDELARLSEASYRCWPTENHRARAAAALAEIDRLNQSVPMSRPDRGKEGTWEAVQNFDEACSEAGRPA
jgi:hypothetical protein